MREWNTLDVIAYGNKLTSRLNGVEVASRRPASGRSGPIGLENAGNNLMYADVRIRELTTDTTAPTITVRNVPDGLVILQGTPFTADYACADEQDLVECSATPIARPRPAATRSGSRPRTPPATTTVVERAYSVVAYTGADGSAGGTVPATLALTLGAPASFGAFMPGRPAGLHRVHDRDRRLHRRRRDADGHRPEHHPSRPARERRVRAAAAAARRGLAAPGDGQDLERARPPTSPCRSPSRRRSAPVTPCAPAPTARP